MPTKTFYNLPEEKRERLLAAIREELARVPFDQVSINRIVHSAGIARGSFYQYFTDKLDMLEVLLSGYCEQGMAYVLNGLRRTGDLFQLFEDILDFAIAFVRKESNMSICRNLFTDMRIGNLLCLHGCWDEAWIEKLSAYIRLSELDLRGPEDLHDMTGVLFAICREAMAEVLADAERWQQTRERYRRRLQLVKRGFVRQP